MANDIAHLSSGEYILHYTHFSIVMSKSRCRQGHLVRRKDPMRGAEFEKANRDTFHFTNCSPQHENFNQSSNLWLILENYILNHATNYQRKVAVFTGPIF